MALTLKTNGENIAKALWPGINQIIQHELEKYVDEALADIKKKITNDLHPHISAFVEPALESRDINLVIDAKFGREFDK